MRLCIVLFKFKVIKSLSPPPEFPCKYTYFINTYTYTCFSTTIITQRIMRLRIVLLLFLFIILRKVFLNPYYCYYCITSLLSSYDVLVSLPPQRPLRIVFFTIACQSPVLRGPPLRPNSNSLALFLYKIYVYSDSGHFGNLLPCTESYKTNYLSKSSYRFF